MLNPQMIQSVTVEVKVLTIKLNSLPRISQVLHFRSSLQNRWSQTGFNQNCSLIVSHEVLSLNFFSNGCFNNLCLVINNSTYGTFYEILIIVDLCL